jgi:hypothetical protein
MFRVRVLQEEDMLTAVGKWGKINEAPKMGCSSTSLSSSSYKGVTAVDDDDSISMGETLRQKSEDWGKIGMSATARP